jgi:hypothetical protein
MFFWMALMFGAHVSDRKWIPIEHETHINEESISVSHDKGLAKIVTGN